MCGINGIFSTSPLPDPSLIGRMNAAIVHRGPDDEGTWCTSTVQLGMRRLSIIDLADGHQPMITPDGRYVLVFNGEIYNFKSLRAALESAGVRFKTHCDTEVILHLFAKHGTDCFEKLEGMFAIAVYDTEKKELVLCRDRLGKKPLYYTFINNRIIFGSELKSIMAVCETRFRLNRISLAHFFQLSYIPAPLTIYEGIHKLPAGSFMRIRPDLSHETINYWNLQSHIPSASTLSPASAQKQLKALLTDCVTKRMVADVPLGVLLSGGVDSSIITAIMASHSDRPVKTFSVANTVGSYNESDKARFVSQLFKTEHTEWVVNPDDLYTYIYEALDTFDEPFSDMAAIPFYVISKKARQQVTVVLTGDGGDEMFGGYTRYLIYRYASMYKKVPSFIRNGVISPLLNNVPVPVSMGLAFNKLRKLAKSASNSDFELYYSMVQLGCSLPEMAALSNGTLTPEKVIDTVQNTYNILGNNVSAIKRSQFCDTVLGLEGQMLPKVDRASMLASLEVRCPFMDHQIAEFAFSLDDSLKINEKTKSLKIILKQAFADMFPPGFLDKPKMGFGIPMAGFLRNELNADLTSFITASPLMASGLINQDFITHALADHNKGKDRTHLLWPYFVFAWWFAKNQDHLHLS